MESISLTISGKSLNVIGAALSELPYKVAKPVIDEIDKQVKEHLATKGRDDDRRKGGALGDSDGHADGAGQGYIDQDRAARR